MTGKLTDEWFAELSATYEAAQAELKQSIVSLRAIVEASKAQAVNVKGFLKITKKYTGPTELPPHHHPWHGHWRTARHRIKVKRLKMAAGLLPPPRFIYA